MITFYICGLVYVIVGMAMATSAIKVLPPGIIPREPLVGLAATITLLWPLFLIILIVATIKAL